MKTANSGRCTAANHLLYRFLMTITKSQKRPVISTIKKIWEYDSKSPIYSDIVCEDVNSDGIEEVMFITGDDVLTVLDIEGNLLWKKRFEPNSIIESMLGDKAKIKLFSSSPRCEDINGNRIKEIIVGATNGRVYALTYDGNIIWEFVTGGPIHSTAEIADINNDGSYEIIIGSDDGNLYALNESGKVLWKYNCGYPIRSKIVAYDIDDDGLMEILFGSESNSFYALDCRGKQRWKFTTNGGVNGAVGIGNIGEEKKLIFGSNDSYIYVLKKNGNLDWKLKSNGVITSDIVLHELWKGMPVIITGVCSRKDNLLIINGKQEEILSFNAGFWITSSPIIRDRSVGKEIIFGSFDHNIYFLRFPSRKNEKVNLSKKIQMFDTGGIIVGKLGIVEKTGYVIAGNSNGRVHCLQNN